jgi:hypothetical protein
VVGTHLGFFCFLNLKQLVYISFFIKSTVTFYFIKRNKWGQLELACEGHYDLGQIPVLTEGELNKAISPSRCALSHGTNGPGRKAGLTNISDVGQACSASA